MSDSTANNKETTTNSTCHYYQIALPVPLRCTFDYTACNESRRHTVGARVEVIFGHRKLIGIILGQRNHTTVDTSKIKAISSVLDQHAIIPEELLKLCLWAAEYYCYPIGEALLATLPPFLRSDKPLPEDEYWALSTKGKGLDENALARAPKQQAILRYLLDHNHLHNDRLSEHAFSRSGLKALIDKELVEACIDTIPTKQSNHLLHEQPLTLNTEQQMAFDQLRHHHFSAYLLHGMTGSGKTELYLQWVAQTLQRGKQALVLVPEIGLSPQTVARFRQRFAVDIVELHSNISETQRAKNWLAAQTGQARIVIGTRLAVFAPFKELGMIIVDEEHDNSYKQQDTFRYSARDCAIYRAKYNHIPIILGSATPSLETLNNALSERYQHLVLKTRAGDASTPVMRTIDLRDQHLTAGLTQEALNTVQTTLNNGYQVLIFLNRKGYAPAQLCHSCGWMSECPHCSSTMTLHSQPPRLHCHHCDRKQRLHPHCPNCQANDMSSKGVGTEQVESQLAQIFTDVPIIRIDRESTRNKTDLKKKLDSIHKGQPCLLIGTQMLAKGHHFSKLKTVIVMDADQGFLSPDFRGLEKMAQLLLQVAGRAGREGLAGDVLLQTHRPDHPLLETLLQKGYFSFARILLQQRADSFLPPFWQTVMIRSESKRADNALQLLKHIHNSYHKHFPPNSDISLIGPMPSSMEKVNDRYRFELRFKARERSALRKVIQVLITETEKTSLSKRVRWSVDVDAVD